MSNFVLLLHRALAQKQEPDDYIVIEPHHWFEVLSLGNETFAYRERYPGYIGPWEDKLPIELTTNTRRKV